ncbi:MAG: HprK-related kinase A [Rubrivivax sp.]|nr:HprK-related kinase A [Rubrivivax sp.]
MSKALLAEKPAHEVRTALRRFRAGGGLRLRMGPYVARIGSPLPEVADAVMELYRHHEVVEDSGFVDFDVAVRRPRSLRALWRPQVVFELDGEEPFNPLPGDQGFPLLEWGLNWCVYGHCHQYLTLHAAVLERGGRALLLPAPSGSGKSTLCAALAFRGWRLLSDELALIDPVAGELLPLPRPVSLKNASIDVIRRFAPEVRFGSMVKETAKGVVAHFAPAESAVQASDKRAAPGWVVFPRYAAGAPARLQRLERARAFVQLVENAFNYDVHGSAGFDLLGSVVDRSDCYTFEYSSLDEAIVAFERLAGSPHG